MSYTISTKMTWAQTMADLKEEFRLWGISFEDWDVEGTKSLKDKYYYTEEERTVTVKYKKNGRIVVLKYGEQKTPKDNLRALYLAIQDMRMLEVRGVGELVASAYRQLGSGDSIPVNQLDGSPYKILGILDGSSLDTAEAVYRNLAKKYHPDTGDSPSIEKFKQISEALKEIRRQHQ